MVSRIWNRRHQFTTLVCVLALAGLLVPGVGTARTAVAPEPQVIQLIPGGDQATVTQLDRDGRELTLQVNVPALELGKETLGQEEFDSIAIPGQDLAGQPGYPTLPVVSQLVAVPAGMTLEFLDLESQTRTLDGRFRPVPAQGLRPSGNNSYAFEAAAYEGGALKSALAPVQVGSPGLMRGLRVVPVTFHPVQWDPESGSLQAAFRLECRFALVPAQDKNNPVGARRPVPESFISLYESTVLGYEKGALESAGLGTWLIIHPTTSGVEAAIGPLVEWRQRQGYNVIMASTDVTGTTAAGIKSYIQNQYDTLDIPLEFVTLVGDADGTVTLAAQREGLSGYNGEGDHDYTRLEGGDVLADIHIGRLSVTSVSELETVVNKIVNYEKAPHMSDDLPWFRRAALTGDPSTSGYSCIWINQWVKEQLEELSYTQIDTIWGGNFRTLMLTSINQGLSLFTYRGYWGMSGLDSPYIATLYNGQKLPFALILTCDTGSFWDDETCRSEAFLRAPNGGGVASVGTATIGTHTRYNNCMFQGIAEGVLNSGDTRVGPGLTRGKLHMYRNYIDSEPDRVEIWSTWNNLMGDPATAIWTAEPAVLTVDYPTELSVGANALPVTVTSGGLPVEGARVALYMKSTVQVNGVTDAGGQILLPLDALAQGVLYVTVTGTNLQPHLGGVNVGNLSVSVDYADQALLDDGSAGTAGNADGLASPGETVAVSLQLANNGTGLAGNVSLSVGQVPAGVTVLNGVASFGSLGPGATAWGDQDLLLALDPALVGGSRLDLELLVTSDAGDWTAALPLPVSGPRGGVDSISLSGPSGSELNPGETADLRLGLINTGDLATTGASAVLSCASPWITVLDGEGTFSAMAPGVAGSNSGDLFAISAAGDCFPGHMATFTLDLTFDEGGTAREEFTVVVGQAASTDPVGPDAHGYYAFDNTDTSYDHAPVYDWVEIDPDQGGTGTGVPLADYAEYQDDTHTLSLPFSFQYYGKSFDQISVCSNGWLAMGQTYLRHYRNWTLPSEGTPDNMIAVFWDDLYLQSGTGGVYTWHDTANHRFVVEWSRVRNTYSNAEETFQVLLYDPAFVAGDFGDGLIVAQYHTVNQADSTTGYATAGIQNEDRDDAVLYTYWNMYPGGAAPLQSGRAVAYRTVAVRPQGVLRGTVNNASGGGTPIDGATITVVGEGRSFMTSNAGLYQGGVPEGTYDVAVSHPSFAPDTTRGVYIVQDQETVVNFSLQDIGGPDFAMVEMPANTDDTTGPYAISVDVSDYSGLQDLHMYYTSSSSGGPFELPLTPAGGDLYTAQVPGQSEGTRIQYWFTAADGLGHTANEPVGAPYAVHSFAVTGFSEIYATDMETDDGWIAGVAGDDATTGIWERVDPNGVIDETLQVVPEDDHSPDGTLCWITGQDPVGASQGNNDVDAGLTTLETPVFDLTGINTVQVQYYRWYTNDTGQNPGSDMWRVQASTGDGNWVNLEETSTSERSWQLRQFNLADYLTLGDQVVFRFLADDAGYGSVIEAGVDDFTLTGYALPGDGADPVVSLTSFGGGQSVSVGSTVPITWDHSDDIGVVRVQVLLSSDGGSSWDTVLADGPLPGSFDWVVAGPANPACRLKVVVHDALGNTAESASGADFAITGVSAAGDIPRQMFSLAQNAPNPFNPRTEIQFSLPASGPVSLKIYNVDGRLVRTLVHERREAGAHTVVWSGADDRGGRVASGLYFYRLTTDAGVLTRKMTLLK